MIRKKDIESLSVQELEALLVMTNEILEVKKLQSQAIEEIIKMAIDKGVDFDSLSKELGAGKKRGGLGQKAPIKWRHPKKPELTWTGRGKSPRWFTEALESGIKEDKLRVK